MDGGREGGMSVESLLLNISSFVCCLLIVYVDLLFLGFFFVILIDYNKYCLRRVFFFCNRRTRILLQLVTKCG